MSNKMAIDSLVNQPTSNDLPENATLAVPAEETLVLSDEAAGPANPNPDVRKNGRTSGLRGRRIKRSSKLALPPQVLDPDTVTVLGDVILDQGEHVIPLGLPTRMHIAYCDIIDEFMAAHKELMMSLKPSRETIAAMERMITKLDGFVTHPELIERVEHEGPAGDGHVEELHYNRMISWKFGLLDMLLVAIHDAAKDGLPEALQGRTKDEGTISIAIVVNEGRLLEMLTRFLVLACLPFTTLHNGEKHNETVSSHLRLVVAPANIDASKDVPSVDMVYALDSSFLRNSDLAKAFRGDGKQETRIIYPWVWGSPEHVRACMPPVTSYVDQLRVFTQILIQIRGQLGKNENEFQTKGKSATKWVLDGFRQTFPEKLSGPIELTGLQLSFKSEKKRSLDETEDDQPISSPKRQRTEELLRDDMAIEEMNPAEKISALREELIRSREQNEDYREALRDAENEMTVMKEEIRETRRAKEELWQKALEHEHTAIGLMNACDAVLTMKEEGQKRIRILQREKEKMESELQQKMALLEQQKTLLDLANSDIAEFKKAMAPDKQVADDASASTTISMEFLKLQSENETLLKDVVSLKKKAASIEADRAYAMQLYQEASSRAVESAQEVNTLQAEVDRLLPMAEGQSLRMLQGIDVSELETTRAALERVIVEKEEAEEQLRRGYGRVGMSTRGQSGVPSSSRSPLVITASPPRSRASSRQP